MAMRWPDDQKSSKFYAKGQLSENKGKKSTRASWLLKLWASKSNLD